MVSLQGNFFTSPSMLSFNCLKALAKSCTASYISAGSTLNWRGLSRPHSASCIFTISNTMGLSGSIKRTPVKFTPEYWYGSRSIVWRSWKGSWELVLIVSKEFSPEFQTKFPPLSRDENERNRFIITREVTIILFFSDMMPTCCACRNTSSNMSMEQSMIMFSNSASFISFITFLQNLPITFPIGIFVWNMHL